MKPRIYLLSLILMTSLPSAFAEDVTITSSYPTPYGEYGNLTTERIFISTDYTGMQPVYPEYDMTAEQSGDSFLGGPLLPVTFKIYGKMNLQGSQFLWFPEWDAYLSVDPNFVDPVTNPVSFVVAPLKGPNGEAAFILDMFARVSIGMGELPRTDGAAQDPLMCHWCVDPNIKFKNLYVFPTYHGYYTGLQPNPHTYGNDIAFVYAEAEHDTSQVGDAGKRACFGAYETSASYVGDPTTYGYAPLNINGSAIHLGVDGASTAGTTQAVLVGTRNAPGTGGMPGGPNTLLLVNGTIKTQGISQFSSAQYKKDIVPLRAPDYDALLAKLNGIEIVRYRYKTDSKEHKLRLGLIAEDAPKEILGEDGKSISLTDSVGFLAGALKALQERNEILKVRLSELQKMKDSAKSNL